MPAIPISLLEKSTEAVGTIKTDPIPFAVNSLEIPPESSANLEKLAQQLSGLKLYILLESYTDQTGSREYNLELSRQRAAAVQKKLTETNMLSASQIITIGYGQERQSVYGNAPSLKQRELRLTVLKSKLDKKSTKKLLRELRARGVDISILKIDADENSTRPRTKELHQNGDITTRNSQVVGIGLNFPSSISLNDSNRDDGLCVFAEVFLKSDSMLKSYFSFRSFTENRTNEQIHESNFGVGYERTFLNYDFIFFTSSHIINFVFLQKSSKQKVLQDISSNTLRTSMNLNYTHSARSYFVIPGLDLRPFFAFDIVIQKDYIDLAFGLGALLKI